MYPPAMKRSRWPFVAAGLLAVLAAGGGGLWLFQSPPAPPPPLPTVQPVAYVAPPPAAIATASEPAIETEVPAARTVLRFAPNPAIIIIDFPTLAEQGRMLNRVAAFVEKAGVPHDRALTDAELAAAIQASGATPDTYYYGHDYRAADLDRFFELADRDHVALDPEEEQLRALDREARAEPAGFGALITLTKVDPDSRVDQAARSTILHHELSHGEFFTNPLYAQAVDHFWQVTMTSAERTAFRTYLAAEGYDPAMEEVMMNEMQAYLMHTADPRFFEPKRLGIPPARLTQLRQLFVAGMPEGWLKDETRY
jgi:hypothetical protein